MKTEEGNIMNIGSPVDIDDGFRAYRETIDLSGWENYIRNQSFANHNSHAHINHSMFQLKYLRIWLPRQILSACEN